MIVDFLPVGQAVNGHHRIAMGIHLEPGNPRPMGFFRAGGFYGTRAAHARQDPQDARDSRDGHGNDVFLDIEDEVKKKLAAPGCPASRGDNADHAGKRSETTGGGLGSKAQSSYVGGFILRNTETRPCLPLTEHVLACA